MIAMGNCSADGLIAYAHVGKVGVHHPEHPVRVAGLRDIIAFSGS
jgi:hypothetical protein